MMKLYPALVYSEKDHAHSVVFPDLKGCFSAADEFKDVFIMAKQALSLHVEGLREDGLPIPEPSQPDAIKSDPEWAKELKDASMILVPLIETASKAKRVNISLDVGVLAAIDQAAKELGVTRSAFLTSAALDHLG